MKNVNFITIFATIALLFGTFFTGTAQNRKALLGSGKLEKVDVPALKPFNGVTISGIPGGNGLIKIIAGTTAAVSIMADDNLSSMFSIEQKNGNLSIAIPGNKNNRMWIEDTHIQITIATPELENLWLDGNMNTEVSQVNSDELTVHKSGNGNLLLSGRTTHFNLEKTGNGDVNAKDLLVKTAAVQSMGNGSVYVNASESLATDRSGNGDVIQSGKGKISKGLDMGNGEVITTDTLNKQKNTPEPEYIAVTLVNKQLQSRDFTVRGRATKKFSYGIEIGPKDSRKESFPVGTQIENKLGKIIYTVQKNDEGKEIELK